MWLSSYDVFANAFILLGSVGVGHLEEYRFYHKRFNAKLGEICYALQYQSYVRMRSEQMGRLRRKAEASHEKSLRHATAHNRVVESDFDPARPWNLIFAMAFEDKVLELRAGI